MFARIGILSLALSCITNGLDLDVNSQESIKSTAAKLAGDIMTAYKANLSDTGIPGIFRDYREPDLNDSSTWDWKAGDQFWQAGAVFEGLIEYSYLTGDTQYDELVSEGMQWQSGEGRNFMPANQSEALFTPAHSTWGLAAMTAAEVGFSKPKDGDWIDYAKTVFDIQASQFEDESKNGTCDGGLEFWIDPYTVKDMGSNGNLFLLAARLARFTGNQTYAAWADKTFSWAKDVGLIFDRDGKIGVYDNLGIGCAISSFTRHSSDYGTVTEGAAIMFNMTGAQNWTETLQGLVRGSSSLQKDNIIMENGCWTDCSPITRALKGIAVRALARAVFSAPCATKTLATMLENSAKKAVSACDGTEDIRCEFNWSGRKSEWNGPRANASYGNLAELFNGMEVVQGLLYLSAKGLRNANGTITGGHCSEPTQNEDTPDPEKNGVASTVVASTAAAGVTAALVAVFATALSF
ncbi:hypothetical protein OPT61_g6913 [Boeremia exigua]|uniref:Uncharacterized protein n=1 Tax=Boeremia exigua TaxID=749465 RepID=A0ACC2I4T3_9PLEO|nr:hypothetical protein OPT61_g6913 [Boeremia exigua]